MTCYKPGCDREVTTQGLCKSHYDHFMYRSGKGADKPRRNRRMKPDGIDRFALPCEFEGCTNTQFNPGLCSGHYYQRLRGEELRPLRERAICSLPGCDNEYSVKLSKTRLCRTHSTLPNKYGRTTDQLVAMFSAGCANPACENVEDLHIDHDHSCCPAGNGKKCGECTRGVLCRGCNHALGNVQDSPEKLSGLIEYLTSR